jgi:hypothetical protein
VLLASFSRRLLVERPTRTENVVVFICVQYSTERWLPQVARKAACTRAGTIKLTSRILVGLTARRGLVEPREDVGCWVSAEQRNGGDVEAVLPRHGQELRFLQARPITMQRSHLG